MGDILSCLQRRVDVYASADVGRADDREETLEFYRQQREIFFDKCTEARIQVQTLDDSVTYCLERGQDVDAADSLKRLQLAKKTLRTNRNKIVTQDDKIAALEGLEFRERRLRANRAFNRLTGSNAKADKVADSEQDVVETLTEHKDLEREVDDASDKYAATRFEEAESDDAAQAEQVSGNDWIKQELERRKLRLRPPNASIMDAIPNPAPVVMEAVHVSRTATAITTTGKAMTAPSTRQDTPVIQEDLVI